MGFACKGWVAWRGGAAHDANCPVPHHVLAAGCQQGPCPLPCPKVMYVQRQLLVHQPQRQHTCIWIVLSSTKQLVSLRQLVQGPSLLRLALGSEDPEPGTATRICCGPSLAAEVLLDALGTTRAEAAGGVLGRIVANAGGGLHGAADGGVALHLDRVVRLPPAHTHRAACSLPHVPAGWCTAPLSTCAHQLRAVFAMQLPCRSDMAARLLTSTSAKYAIAPVRRSCHTCTHLLLAGASVYTMPAAGVLWNRKALPLSVVTLTPSCWTPCIRRHATDC